MDSFFRRLEKRIVSVKVPMERTQVDEAIVPATYSNKNVVEAAMVCAQLAISYQNVSKSNKEHTFIKVVCVNLTSRYNMVKDVSHSIVAQQNAVR